MTRKKISITPETRHEARALLSTLMTNTFYLCEGAEKHNTSNGNAATYSSLSYLIGRGGKVTDLYNLYRKSDQVTVLLMLSIPEAKTSGDGFFFLRYGDEIFIDSQQSVDIILASEPPETVGGIVRQKKFTLSTAEDSQLGEGENELFVGFIDNEVDTLLRKGEFRQELENAHL